MAIQCSIRCIVIYLIEHYIAIYDDYIEAVTKKKGELIEYEGRKAFIFKFSFINIP